MSDLKMKNVLVDGVRELMPPSIARQTKEIVIPEVVRLVFDQTEALGITILPPAEGPAEHWDRKDVVTRRLYVIYERYDCRDASIGDIITDLIAVLRERQLKIITLCAID